ncbi:MULTISPECIES: GNAT family N-acetyltransferase [Bacillus cereus group]|uniref:GNAT family N-acetyltransferase n=1 Tax=Bacillus cereus TaxID=1396 RepID=A0AA44QEL3_BACCE|nr:MULTISPECIES: GNAT family N-acetyltransferase [Bacillus cereus group]PFA25119.1 GNAT family N-acetyltransferase [Bacillus cereus]PFN06281.1 GNAT family N-acetyltransferase [Bacillus cereus]PFO83171.1 GNAT family N-acetyltransferase [Bacillus cereus]PFS07697.1 GNAT family N-acetyltransferase [Bacillus cereus]PGZ16799.1 GNAT family N-acetyltransferase [Bacillus cereus]
MITTERIEGKDIPYLLHLSESVGWDYSSEEIKTIFQSGIVYGGKNMKGEIIASAAIILYGEKLASIGMVIVHPWYKGKGIGRKITEACIRSVSEKTSIMLIATEEGKPLYEKLGFQVVSHVSKYICNQYVTLKGYDGSEQYIFMDYDKGDRNRIVELDEAAFGVNRHNFIQRRIEQSEQFVVVKDKENYIVGYGMSVQTPENRIIGPIVALNDNIASGIVHHLAKDYNGKLRVDVPERKEIFMEVLEKAGFQKVNQPPIMLRNSNQFLKRNGELYGIAAQIFG